MPVLLIQIQRKYQAKKKKTETSISADKSKQHDEPLNVQTNKQTKNTFDLNLATVNLQLYEICNAL